MMFNQSKNLVILLLCLVVVLISQIAQFRRYDQDTIVTPAPTATPWVKQDILIETKSGKGLDVWTDNVGTDMYKINEIEGVVSTLLLANDHMIYVQIDPRYDKALIAKAIADRLIMGTNLKVR